MRQDLIKIEINADATVNISTSYTNNAQPFCKVRLSSIEGLKLYAMCNHEVCSLYDEKKRNKFKLFWLLRCSI